MHASRWPARSRAARGPGTACAAGRDNSTQQVTVPAAPLKSIKESPDAGRLLSHHHTVVLVALNFPEVETTAIGVRIADA